MSCSTFDDIFVVFFLETLIVDTKPLSQEEKDAIEKAKRLAEDEILARQLAEPGEGAALGVTNGILLKQVVDADNSCLFTSIGFILSGKVDTTCGGYMREIIASTVHNEKETYNSGILGRDNAEYCAWIMQESNWGGAIEVSILSQHYGIEFDVVDITNAMINRFGEDKHYPMRGFLLYDGIHYDPLYLESFSGDSQKTLFSVEDESNIFEMAQSLANEAKSSRLVNFCSNSAVFINASNGYVGLDGDFPLNKFQFALFDVFSSSSFTREDKLREAHAIRSSAAP